MAKNSNLKWEVITWSPSPAAGNESVDFTILPTLAETSQETIDVIDSQALESHDREQLTLIRVVGCIRMATTSAAGAAGSPAAVKIRLHKGIEVQVDGAPIIAYADPWDGADAEEEFLWERTYDVHGVSAATNIVDWQALMVPGGAPPCRGDHPYWSEIDIKLKRTVRPPEVLGLTFAAKGVNADRVRVWAWLRALIAV